MIQLAWGPKIHAGAVADPTEIVTGISKGTSTRNETSVIRDPAWIFVRLRILRVMSFDIFRTPSGFVPRRTAGSVRAYRGPPPLRRKR
jgi:hypothetical protein